jgi:hypothetical protein
MRRELFNRGLDLPADVLQTTEVSPTIEEHFEVELNDAGLIEHSLIPGKQVSPKSAQK